MNELALFAGAGGGILGGKLLGWRTMCAVEWDAYAASVLVARQNDGSLAPFPIWDDVRTFDGRPLRGLIDVVSGGFPCTDISSAGKGAGIEGEASSMWKHMARIVGDVLPEFVYVENSPILTSRGLGVVLGDLAALGFDAAWRVLSAEDLGAHHERERIWIVAHAQSQRWREARELRCDESSQWAGGRGETVPHSHSHSQGLAQRQGERGDARKEFAAFERVRRWPTEPELGRVADGVARRVDRLRAIGNGQVPRVAAAAFAELAQQFE